MKEYIERAAIEKFIEDGLNNPDKNKAFGHDAIEIMAEIHYMQAADVVEVRHAKWEEFDPGDGSRKWRCTDCKREILWYDSIRYRYCPSCGARMDKEDEHEVD